MDIVVSNKFAVVIRSEEIIFADIATFLPFEQWISVTITTGNSLEVQIIF